MKRALTLLLALLMLWTLAACSESTSDRKKDSKQDKTSDTQKPEETEPEAPASNLPFEFTYKGLKLQVTTAEDYEYNAEEDNFDAPQGKYVAAGCSILEGEAPTGDLGGLYDCLKMNGYEPASIGTSGVMSLVSGQMYVGTETVLTFRFDVPEDFDAAGAVFTAD